MTTWEIIDDESVIYSGFSEEETTSLFRNLAEGTDSYEWTGDLKLTEVHDLTR